MEKRMAFVSTLSLALLAAWPAWSIAAPPGQTASAALWGEARSYPPAIGADTQALSADVYQDMESGNAGDLLTPEMMNAASHGGVGDEITATWSISGSLWVSTDHARSLPDAVSVNGKEYDVSSTRTWMFSDKYDYHYVEVNYGSNQWGAPYHDRMTVAGYFTPGPTRPVWNSHDNIVISGNESFGVLQTIKLGTDNPLQLRAHSCTQPGWTTTVSPGIGVVAGKTYWFNLHYDGIAGQVKVAVFDPDDGWSQVGETVVAESVPGSTVRSRARFGRCSPHGDHNTWPDETFSYLGHILIDYTDAAFPLLPGTSPAPELELYGVPANQAIHLSWDVNADLPPASTWRISYVSATGTALFPAAEIPTSTVRAWTLTGLTNNVWYTVTLNAMLDSTPFLTDTVRVMPTGIHVYLPLVLK